MFAKPYTDWQEVANPTPSLYDPTIFYGYSKLANLLFTIELHQLYGQQGLKAYAVHPGAVKTELTRHLPTMVQMVLEPLMMLAFKTPLEGSQTSLYCAIHPEVGRSVLLFRVGSGEWEFVNEKSE